MEEEAAFLHHLQAVLAGQPAHAAASHFSHPSPCFPLFPALSSFSAPPALPTTFICLYKNEGLLPLVGNGISRAAMFLLRMNITPSQPILPVFWREGDGDSRGRTVSGP